jgi:hypothetical protein
VQVQRLTPVMKAPGSMRFKLSHDGPLSKIAFKFNLRRYMKVAAVVAARAEAAREVGAYTRSHFRST